MRAIAEMNHEERRRVAWWLDRVIALGQALGRPEQRSEVLALRAAVRNAAGLPEAGRSAVATQVEPAEIVDDFLFWLGNARHHSSAVESRTAERPKTEEVLNQRLFEAESTHQFNPTDASAAELKRLRSALRRVDYWMEWHRAGRTGALETAGRCMNGLDGGLDSASSDLVLTHRLMAYASQHHGNVSQRTVELLADLTNAEQALFEFTEAETWDDAFRLALAVAEVLESRETTAQYRRYEKGLAEERGWRGLLLGGSVSQERRRR